MEEGGKTATLWLRALRARLLRYRVPLLAAAIALFGLDLSLGGNGLGAVIALACTALVTIVLAEDGQALSPAQPSAKGAASIDSMSALDLAKAVQDPLYIFDSSGTVIYANEAAIGAFGPIAPGVSLQLKFRAPEMHDFIGRVLKEETHQSTDYAERVPFERAFRVSAVPMGKNSGLFVLLFKDQSEARRIDRMRADFIANASHELRTPLASIAGFIETLRGPARNDAKARENFLQIMQSQTSRMARLIDDLLSLSRLEAKPYFKPSERVDLRSLLQGTTDSLSHVAAEAGVKIDLDLPNGSLEVAGNRDELMQVFENLLENACKYGSSGGRVVVSASTVDPSSGKTITVTDFGPGIAEEHIPRVTERFYRVEVEPNNVQKGTGLGLAIVKHILTRHGAHLSIRSKLGEGSSFTVHFPPG
ncbi:ATP-binding protein [Chelativorans sp. Marseille-P2723]|uniref:ATP-binding protein n=1 Tax=Chelativorans sp. Marseille-P2723 TaxID=2709133 RepID=UPI00156E6407|nr:ATP-binding protein [Chelativorans sp. Marseille-P2723]